MFSARSWPSEIIIYFIEDEYGSIFIFTVFEVFHFWLIVGNFGNFWAFLAFLGFSGGWGVLGVLVSYKITRGITLVVGRVNDWVWGDLGVF